MFLCRATRTYAAVLDRTLNAPGLFRARVKATRPGNVTSALRNGYTSLSPRCVCLSTGAAAQSKSEQVGKRQSNPGPVRAWDSPSNWGGHLDRVSTIAASLSTSVGGTSCVFRQRLHADSAVDILFLAGSTGPRWSTMQTRASSTAPATQKRDPDAAEDLTAVNKGEELHLKEASTVASSSSSPSSSSTMKAPEEAEPEGGKPSKTQQLKKVFKQYGAVGVSFHVVISLMSLGMFYLLVSSGIDMAAMLCKLGFSEAVVQSKMAAGTSTFVLAYAVHKLFAPVRMSITLVSVPLIVRHFRKTGLFKPPTPAP
ncbi:protein FAM210B, mitochondrial [Genypterus blacodes]|uniref:protein FAM210B, mitochondrial n=1 Tax=Genypterus blacodes TaxID=154954 RepID=UPI003F76CBD8